MIGCCKYAHLVVAIGYIPIFIVRTLLAPAPFPSLPTCMYIQVLYILEGFELLFSSYHMETTSLPPVHFYEYGSRNLPITRK